MSAARCFLRVTALLLQGSHAELVELDGAYAALLRMQGPTAGGAITIARGSEEEQQQTQRAHEQQRQERPPLLEEDSALSLHGGGGGGRSRGSDETEISTAGEDDGSGGQAESDAATGMVATGGVVVVCVTTPADSARRSSGAGSALGRANSEGRERIRCSGEGWRKEVEGSAKGKAYYYNSSGSGSGGGGGATIAPSKGAAAGPSSSRALSAGKGEGKTPAAADVSADGAGGEAKPVSLWRLFDFGRPKAGFFALALLFALCQGAQTPVFSLIFSRLIGVFFEPDDAKMRQGAIFWALIMFSIGIASFFVLVGVSYCAGVFAQHLVMHLRRQAFAAAVRQEIAYFEDPRNNAGAAARPLVA